MSVTLADTPNDREKAAVYGWLREFNHARNSAMMKARDDGAEKPLFLVARDGSRDVIGGLEGTLFFKWLRIEIMAVAPNMRGQGVGTRLLQRAEQLAQDAGCTHAYVDTMSYQAPDFYRSHGFKEAGKLPDWDSHGHDKLFFVKVLTTETE